MRDIFVTTLVFGSLPFILKRPWFGIIVWTWLAFMNPHRLTWGFAYSMPFAYIVAVTTLFGMLISREPKRIPWTRETNVLLLFISWMAVTTVLSLFPELAWKQLEKVAKIQLMIFVALMLMAERERVQALVWTIVVSLGFYGVKGGIFTVLNGGAYHVRGPAGSFIGGDNEVGLALIMTIPLMRYLQLSSTRAIVRWGFMPAILFTALAIVGSQSRGAFVGLIAMGAFLWLKSRNKFLTIILIAIAAVPIALVMPEQWWERMQSIKDYEEDGSAQGRIAAWGMAINLAKDRFFGGGFEAFQRSMFQLYAPAYSGRHDAHSIYFEVLGEHGFVGLGLFLLLGLLTWLSASWIIRNARRDPTTAWMADLAAMVQVSMVGYASAGAFLGLAYFDLYYNLVVIVILCKTLLLRHLASGQTAPIAKAASPGLAGERSAFAGGP